MGLSKTNRIIILLVIDTAFFLLELITGELADKRALNRPKELALEFSY